MQVKNLVSVLPWHPTRKWKKRKNDDIKRIVVHTTGSSNQNPQVTNAYHITPGPLNYISKKGCPHLCYHLFILKNGIVDLCNPFEDITWHCGLWNTSSIGIAMAFNGEISSESPTVEQFASLEACLVTLCLKFKISPTQVWGHREVPGMYTLLGNGSRKYKKVCPGLALNLDALRSSLAMRLQCLLATRVIDGSLIPTGVWSKDWNEALKIHATSLYFEGRYPL